MVKSEFLEFLWSVGQCKSVEMQFYPEGEYAVKSPGMRIEGSATALSSCVVESLTSTDRYCGAVRIDSRSSDWRNEGTLDDPTYDNVAVHVVAQYDAVLLRANKSPLLCCAITPSKDLLEEYKRLPISCINRWKKIPSLKRTEMLSRLFDDRIKRKTEEMNGFIEEWQLPFDEACYLLFMRGMGTPTRTKDEFEEMGRIVNYHFIKIHRREPIYIEGSMLGVADYLDIEEPDGYTLTLIKEYNNYARSNIETIEEIAFNKSQGIEYHSAPALALVQAVMILTQRPKLFEDMFQTNSVAELRALFTVEMPHYWCTHAEPSNEVSKVSKTISEGRVDLLLINFALPLLLSRAKDAGDYELWQKYMGYYEKMNAENFSLCKKRSCEEWAPHSAFDSQALVQLDQEYCRKGCTAKCMIAQDILHNAIKSRE